MASAAGLAASPGIVMIDPVFTTTNPAPADGVTARTVKIRKMTRGAAPLAVDDYLTSGGRRLTTTVGTSNSSFST